MSGKKNKLEIITTSYIDSYKSVVKYFKGSKHNYKFRLIEKDFSAYLDYMRNNETRLPIYVIDNHCFHSDDMEKVEKFIKREIKGDWKK